MAEVVGRPFHRRIRHLFWEHNLPLRRVLRRIKANAALSRHRIKHFLGRGGGVRVVSEAARPPHPVIAHPAITLLGGSTTHQTERSLAASETAESASFLAYAEGLERLPSVHLEAMLMAAAAEDLRWVAAGWSAPAPGIYGPSGIVARSGDVPAPTHLLLRSPAATSGRRTAVAGRAIGHITVDQHPSESKAIDDFDAAGPYRLHPEAARRPMASCSWHPVDRVLAELPTVDGPPTALFLLPFLAVGGAERLLFDLLEGLADHSRLLIATTDPHLADLGATVDRARELTPHVYTLGDWLPRPAIPSAISHLIRRWQVGTLVSWNGSVLFYDEAARLRSSFPELRIVNQLYNHRGGWIEHLCPSLIEAVDTQIAVNSPIARALVEEHGVAEDKVATIHHAVGDPGPRVEERRARLRSELGVDDSTLVVGTFIRMHPQKRPLDIVRVARRMTSDPVHFLLVGGGPLDAELDKEIQRDPPPNLSRWPMQTDAAPLYDAIDLCLMASDFEGLPVFLLDGMARGLPCVATAVGDIPLLVGDGGGISVDRVGDIDALAEAVRSFIDPERRRAAGEQARSTVQERFNLARYVEEYERIIFGDN